MGRAPSIATRIEPHPLPPKHTRETWQLQVKPDCSVPRMRRGRGHLEAFPVDGFVAVLVSRKQFRVLRKPGMSQSGKCRSDPPVLPRVPVSSRGALHSTP
jgi:hypothetical protein